jgi:hypothetical protein
MGNLFVGVLGVVVGYSILAYRRTCKACERLITHVGR